MGRNLAFPIISKHCRNAACCSNRTSMVSHLTYTYRVALCVFVCRRYRTPSVLASLPHLPPPPLHPPLIIRTHSSSSGSTHTMCRSSSFSSVTNDLSHYFAYYARSDTREHDNTRVHP